MQGAASAVPGGLCPSLLPAPVPCSAFFSSRGGGQGGSLRPLAWLGVARPPAGGPALTCWPCALWRRHVGAWGGAPLAWVWGVRGRALPHTRPPVLGVCAQGPLPSGCGRGGCGPGDPSPTPQRALWRAGFAPCGGGTRAPGGWCLLPGCGTSWFGRSPAPDRPSLGRAAGARYPLAVDAGRVGVGTRHQPHSARSCELALPALRAAGAARGRREGGVPLAWVWCVWGLALSRAPCANPLGMRPGPATHWLLEQRVWAGGPGTNPTARTLASWLCQLCALRGRHEGARGGVPLAWVWGVRGWAPSHVCPWGVRPGPATHWLWVRGLWAWGPISNPTASALASWLSTLRGRREICQGGGASCLGKGCLGLGGLPRPTARLWGARSGPTTHWLWVRCVAVPTPLASAPSPVPRFFVCCARSPGFLAGGACSSLAPVLVPWLWPAACLSVVLCSPAA